jgi:DNA polymerase-3 subunit alpha
METPKPMTEVDGRKITSQGCSRSAMALEGLNRQAGMHAAGSSSPTARCGSSCPSIKPPGEDYLVTQFAKDEVEAAVW